MALTKKNYVDLTGLSTFKSSLLGTVINDSNKAYIALQKLVDVMEERYSLFEETGVSNIKQYNEEALDIEKKVEILGIRLLRS